jgi:hypothetical protein
MTLFLWCFYWFFSYCSLEISPFFLMIALILFLKLVFQHASKGDSNTLFSNQTLHLVNPHDKLSIFVLYPSLGFPNIYQLTLWDPRLRHLSLSLVTCRTDVLWWRTWALMISVFCLEWLRYNGPPYPCSWSSRVCIIMWHLHLLCERSHTLSLYLLEMWNCSCAYLIS